MAVVLPHAFHLLLVGLGLAGLVLVTIEATGVHRITAPSGILALTTTGREARDGQSYLKEHTVSQYTDSSPEARGFVPSNRAIRLTFAYEGREIRLIARQDLEKITPASDPLQERQQDQSGFWVEVQGEQGEPLYRRVMHNPIETSVEVRSGDPQRPFARVPGDQPRGTFFVIIPALPNAASVAVFSSPIDPRDERATMSPAREIARFDLRQRPERRRPEAPSPPVSPPEQRRQGRRQGDAQ